MDMNCGRLDGCASVFEYVRATLIVGRIAFYHRTIVRQ